MLKDILIKRLVRTSSTICINKSRCLRIRFNKNECNRCAGICPSGSITLDAGSVELKSSECSECMLCVSECPSSCFEIDSIDFFEVLTKLSDLPSPVLGCNQKPALKTNVRTPCLGFLSEEHLISLSFLIKKPLQINLTECKKCKNGFIVNSLTKRLENLKNNITGSISEKIRLVENKTDLDYRERVYSRRDLFKGIGVYSARETTSLFKNSGSDDITQAYSDKVVPFKKTLLNKTLSVLSGDLKKRMLENYYYDLHIDGNCNGCSACVGICPTGALISDNRETSQRLLFISARCSGCGLCAGFCRVNAVEIKTGFMGDDPFKLTPGSFSF